MVKSVSGSTFGYTDTGLTNGTIYYYEITAINSVGEGPPSSQLPGVPGGPNLGGVSCVSSTACKAVGFYTNSSGVQVALAERWNGTAWSNQSVPKPTGATKVTLNGVSCVSSTACKAVGFYTNSSGVQVALAERWNGTAWSNQSVPKPTGATKVTLNGVSCVSSTACKAVGFYTNSSGVQVALAERWNGTAWSNQSVPGP